jgi:hypothetical protein
VLPDGSPSWVNLIQYDNLSGSAGINSRLRWNPRVVPTIDITRPRAPAPGRFQLFADLIPLKRRFTG